MRRIKVLLAVVAAVATMIVMAAPAMARDDFAVLGRSCLDGIPVGDDLILVNRDDLEDCLDDLEDDLDDAHLVFLGSDVGFLV